MKKEFSIDTKENIYTYPTKFLYSHLKLNEGQGDILYDYSGNNNNLTYYTGGTYSSANDAGVWTPTGLLFPATSISGNSFVASSSTDYSFDNYNQSHIYVFSITQNGAPTATYNIFSKRGGAAGNADAGYQLEVLSTLQPRLMLHDGISTLLLNDNTSAVPIGEKTTIAYTYDATTQLYSNIIASDTSVVLYTESTKSAPSAYVPYTLSTEVACLGARSLSLPSSEPALDVEIHNARFYTDPNGGALPSNLLTIIRWLHNNQEYNIPKYWWD